MNFCQLGSHCKVNYSEFRFLKMAEIPYFETASNTIGHDHSANSTPPTMLSPDDDEFGGRTPTMEEDGMLQRDIQNQTAFYDYVSEKSFHQTESKLFYRAHQQDAASITEDPSLEIDSIHGTNGFENEQDEDKTINGRQQTIGHPENFSSIDLPSRSGNPRSVEEYNSDRTRKQPAQRYQDPARLSDAMIQNDLLPNGGHRISPAAIASLPTPNELGVGHGGVEAITSKIPAQDLEITAELSTIYTNIQKILDKRHKYIRLSLQENETNPKNDPSWNIYPPPPEPAWNEEPTQSNFSSDGGNLRLNRARTEGDEPSYTVQPPTRKGRKQGQDIGEDFDMSDLLPLPDESEMVFKLDDAGVFQAYENAKSAEISSPIQAIPTIRDFYLDLDEILQISSDGPTKSFAFRRLQYLEGKFNLHFLLHEYQEIADSKRVPHRDFYNVRKVDTHVHHSSCMNQKHLLRFIKSKMKKSPKEVVMFRDGKELTLEQVFESINLTAYDLSIDTLDMHVRSKVSCYRA